MPASSSVSHREPMRTNSEAAMTGVAVLSRTSTVRPLGSCWRGLARRRPRPAHPSARGEPPRPPRRARHGRARGTKASRA